MLGDVVDLLQVVEDVRHLLCDHLPTLFSIVCYVAQPPDVDAIWVVSA